MANNTNKYLRVLEVGVGIDSRLDGCKWLPDVLGVDKLPRA